MLTDSRAARPAPAAAAGPATARDPFFDRARLLATVLVVCGHFWEPLARMPGHRVLHAAYLLVYAFHMPVFVFLSGWFSRSFAARPEQLDRLLGGVLAPYLLWTTLLGWYSARLAGAPFAPDLITPVWVTWFLLSLFLWRLSAPLWHRLRAPLATAVAVSLLAGALPLTPQLSIGRTLQLLPFFVAGLVLDRRRVLALRGHRWLRAAAPPVFGAAALLAYWLVPRLDAAWFYRSAGAAGLHAGLPRWLVLSAAVNLAGAVLGACFLALVPVRARWYDGLGATGTAAFLLHPFAQLALVRAGGYRTAFLGSAAGQAVLTAAACALALLLSTRPVARLLRPLLAPRLRLLLRARQPSPAPAPAPTMIPGNCRPPGPDDDGRSGGRNTGG
ncbi:acyltransferase family protein [Kitasatospora cineracea]|uniref:Fucose 4-O-acetylase-like acetyltransferase n=1 Tax=Kitasatospora cineracea TaxID=88074 RepID=A0A3N4RQ41_9ACTN|nr:acyltransferase family protein [Kitasatospora cineracea]RPE32991.1 fucose 4-O-acetylase-like acetyltransferase [Kitasatospora cineracea]